MASEYEDRKRLTFEQAEGAEPLPSQLQTKQMSSELHALLWEVLHNSMQRGMAAGFRGRNPGVEYSIICTSKETINRPTSSTTLPTQRC